MKKIRFVPRDEYVKKNIPPPLPAKIFIADWYKSGEMYIDLETLKATKNNNSNIGGGMKSCVPFLDSMISGYMLYTWNDINIYENDEFGIKWSDVRLNEFNNTYEEYKEEKSIIDIRRGDIGRTIPRPHGHNEQSLIWSSVWGIRLPRKWSLLVSHPFNRFDLPFTTLTAFMDADEWWTSGNIPFFIKNGWTGIIPKGTPIAQLIPIKRQSWYSYTSGFSIKRSNHIGNEARKVDVGYYKKHIWDRKEYN